MKILRTKDDYVTRWDLRDWLNEKNVLTGDKFAISWKIGKRRKLKAYRLLDITGWECDSCGWITEIELGRLGRSIKMDNHFGPSSFGPNA